MKMKIDIVLAAYYIISICENNTINNLRLQTLMYLSNIYLSKYCDEFEGYDDTFHRDEDFDIAFKSDKIHKEFGYLRPCTIQKENSEKNELLNSSIKKSLDEFIYFLKDFSTFDLVTLANSENNWEVD